MDWNKIYIVKTHWHYIWNEELQKFDMVVCEKEECNAKSSDN